MRDRHLLSRLSRVPKAERAVATGRQVVASRTEAVVPGDPESFGILRIRVRLAPLDRMDHEVVNSVLRDCSLQRDAATASPSVVPPPVLQVDRPSDIALLVR